MSTFIMEGAVEKDRADMILDNIRECVSELIVNFSERGDVSSVICDKGKFG